MRRTLTYVRISSMDTLTPLRPASKAVPFRSDAAVAAMLVLRGVEMPGGSLHVPCYKYGEHARWRDGD